MAVEGIYFKLYGVWVRPKDKEKALERFETRYTEKNGYTVKDFDGQKFSLYSIFQHKEEAENESAEWKESGWVAKVIDIDC